MALQGCGSPEPDPGPTEYVRFKYTVTPPGLSTGADPMVLTVGPAPNSMGVTCTRSDSKITVYAVNAPAAITITLIGAAASTPNQKNLQATTQSVGSAEVELQIPTTIDETGTYGSPATFKTVAAGNALTCLLNTGGPDLYSSFDGTFTCASLSTDPGRKLNLTEGQFHALPCPASGG